MAFAEMMPQLRAEESFGAVEAIQVASGSVDEETGREIIARWSGYLPQQRTKVPAGDFPKRLAASGIALVIEEPRG